MEAFGTDAIERTEGFMLQDPVIDGFLRLGHSSLETLSLKVVRLSFVKTAFVTAAIFGKDQLPQRQALTQKQAAKLNATEDMVESILQTIAAHAKKLTPL